MDVLVERVAGLDVGKEIVVVCVRTPGQGGRRVSETLTYRTMSRSLDAMGPSSTRPDDSGRMRCQWPTGTADFPARRSGP
jgi:hypothetical protein